MRRVNGCLDRTGSFSDSQQCGRVGLVESALKIGACRTAVDSARVDQTKEQVPLPEERLRDDDVDATGEREVRVAPVVGLLGRVLEPRQL